MQFNPDTPFSHSQFLELMETSKGSISIYGIDPNDLYQALKQETLASREHSPQRHMTTSAAVFSPDLSHVLLIHHRKYNEWLYPGGHNDGDWWTLRVALKECLEETSVGEVNILHPHWAQNLPNPDQYPHYIQHFPVPAMPKAPAHFHLDFIFAFQALHTDKINRNSESNDIQWYPIEKMSQQWNDMHVFKDGISLDTCALCLRLWKSLKNISSPLF